MEGLRVPSYLKSHWKIESTLFRVLGSTMADVRFKNPAVFDLFDEMLYQNRYGDVLLTRSSGDRESQEFIEEWLCLPQKLDGLTKKVEKQGCTPEALSTIRSWFTLNRVLNYASKEIYEKNTIDWGKYSRNAEFYDRPSEELAMVLALEESFNKLRPDEPDYKKKCSLLFRSLSSYGFIYTLTSVAEGTDDTIRGSNNPKIKRLGAMLMAAQLLDDFSSPVKDIKHHILGTIATEYDESHINRDHRLHISPEEAIKGIRRARNILSATLNQSGFEKGSKQRELIKYALFILAGLSGPNDNKKYGGSEYPKLFTLIESCKELFSETDFAETALVQRLLEEGMNVVEELYS